MSKSEMVFAFVFAQNFCSGIERVHQSEEGVDYFARTCYAKAMLAVEMLRLAAGKMQGVSPENIQ